MRTFEQINADPRYATSTSDAAALRALAAEMQMAEAVECYRSGIVACRTGAYMDAQWRFRRALWLFEELRIRRGVAAATGNIGIVYDLTGDYLLALKCYHLARQLHEELGDRVGAAVVIGNTGIVFYETGNYSVALEYYLHALQGYEALGNRIGVALVTGNIGDVYHSIGDYATALEYFHHAQKVYEELGDRSGVAQVTCSMGNVYESTGDYPSALEHYHRSLQEYEVLGGNPTQVALVSHNIASVYHSTGNYTSALEYYMRAQNVHEVRFDRASEVRVIGNMIRVLTALDQHDEVATLLEHQEASQLYDQEAQYQHCLSKAEYAEYRQEIVAAQQYYMEALLIANEAGLRSQAADVHKSLRDLAQKRNDFAGYIEHNNEFLRITEEIRGKEATQKLAMMEAERKMEGERREREKERALLYGALPTEIANRMVRGEDVSGDHFDNAAVMFIDIVGFTSHTSHMPPNDVVKMLEHIFGTIDTICAKHDVIKVKTIGDSYMCFAHEGNGELGMGNEQRVAAVALAIQQTEFYWPREDLLDRLSFRIGIHSGPATAGVIGTQRLQYDVWGDTVNVASRMESTSEPGKIHVSEAFASFLGLRPRNDSTSVPHDVQDDSSFAVDGEGRDVIPSVSEEPGTWHLVLRGATELKGKGTMTTYWLERNLPVQHESAGGPEAVADDGLSG